MLYFNSTNGYKKLRAMLAASNTRAYVYFQTTDPFGGTCSWKSYYQGID